MRPIRLFAAAVLLACLALGAPGLAAPASPAGLASVFRVQVERRLDVPAADAGRYAQWAEQALAQAGVAAQADEYLLVVDRNEWVQAGLLFLRERQGRYELVGTFPVSTGLPGAAGPSETPLGVFVHAPWNPDFRSDGSVNAEGLREAGAPGLRVYGLGRPAAPDRAAESAGYRTSLQMHATDSDALEPLLGTSQPGGAIRIPAAANRFVDLFGILDAEYERAVREGKPQPVLAVDRDPVQQAGRWVVVVDSGAVARPEWSPVPFRPHRRRVAPPAPPGPTHPPVQPSYPLRRR